MRIVELILDDEKAIGVEAISIVESPAIEENFIALNKEYEIKLAEVDSEKRILMGAALIPNKNIYRRNGDDEYYIFFSKDTVKKASELYLINGHQNNTTLEHQKKIKDLSVVESWIVESEVDKSRNYGLEMPIGTWMVSMKVNNEDVWQEFVKTKKVKGFSIEGYFSDKVEMSLKINKKEMEKNVIIEKIKSLIEKSELKNQKIELGLIDDINKLKIAANNSEDSSINELKKGISILENSIKMFDSAINASKQVLEGIDKAKIMAKELGVDLPNNIDASYKYYQGSIKMITSIKNDINNFKSKVSS